LLISLLEALNEDLNQLPMTKQSCPPMDLEAMPGMKLHRTGNVVMIVSASDFRVQVRIRRNSE
jgi:hypothetical protein